MNSKKRNDAPVRTASVLTDAVDLGDAVKDKSMTKDELDFIIQKGEDQFTEFKEKLDKSLSKEIILP